MGQRPRLRPTGKTLGEAKRLALTDICLYTCRMRRNGTAMTGYVPLWCKSNFSFLEGVSHPEELVRRCRELAIPALVLADRDGVYGVVRAHLAAGDHGPRLIIGAQLTVVDSPEEAATGAGGGAAAAVLLVQRKEGYANLCRLISRGRLRCPKGECRVSWEEVCTHAGGLIALWEGRHLLAGHGEEGWRRRTSQLREAFPSRLYGLVTRHRLAADAAVERRLTALCRGLAIPQAAATEVLYHHRDRRRLQDVVTCIRHRTTLHAAGTLLRPNAEHALKSPAGVRAPVCGPPRAGSPPPSRSPTAAPSRWPSCATATPPNGCRRGTPRRSGCATLPSPGRAGATAVPCPPAVARQLGTELAVIEELDYCGYFLTMYEIVRFCRAQRILCQGRGSAANSAVCYCLGITAIDPVRMDLLFERFLSRERARAARHRPGYRSPPPRGGDSVHVPEVRARARGDGRQRGALPPQVGHPRGRQSPRHAGYRAGPGGAAHLPTTTATSPWR